MCVRSLGMRRSYPMDEVDLAILRELARDARLPMSDLAKGVHLSRAHVYRRVEALRSAGVIRGFSADIDAYAAGLRATALVFLQAHQERWQELHGAVQDMPQVQFAAAITGDLDIVVLVRAESVEVLRDVVLRRFALLNAVERTRTLVVLDELVSPRPVLP